ncbi:MAG TPA: protein kinase [Pyrinomonadaceae bacterium]
MADRKSVAASRANSLRGEATPMNADLANPKWKRVKEIFHEALRRQPPDRDAYLDESCNGDVGLRIEVESLLLSLNEAKSFLEEPAFMSSADRDVLWQFENGDLVSHYRIVEPIGVGGMGQVYLAEDQKLHRQVALKILPNEVLENNDRLRRFKREALAVSALNHPNILTVFEFDDVDGVPLLASEYVRGSTLRERLEEGPLELGTAIDVAVQVASALQTAHAAGIIHRDIKPENIMIRDDGYVKVLDFGLAKLTGDMRSLETDNTRTQAFSMPGIIMGTATYMSPEQARSRSVDFRTDIFSFGIVLYEMCAGRPPFTGETTTDIIAEIIQKKPSNASAHNPAIPAELDRIINKCLEKECSDRYQTAADLLVDMKTLSKPVEARETTPVESQETQEFQRTPQTDPSQQSPIGGYQNQRLAAVAAGVILILGLIAASYWYFYRDNQIASIAVLPFTNESGNADIEYLSDGMTESLINTLSTLPNLSVKARNTVFRYKGVDNIDEKKVAHELSVQALLLGRVTQRGDDLTLHLSLVDAANGKNLWGEQYDRKIQDLAVLQREITRDVSQKLRARLSNADARDLTKSYTPNSEAYQDYLKGRYFWNKRTPETIPKAIEYFDLAIAKDPGFALAYAGLADSYVVPANRMAPREAMPKAKAAAIRALQIDDSLAEAHTSLARVLQVYEWNWKEAEKEYKRAIELNPAYPVSQQWYRGYFESPLDEALAQRRIAVQLDPLSPIANFELGRAFYLGRQYDKALEQLNKTLELDPSFPAALQYLPLVYIQKGMHDQAVAKVKEVPGSSAMVVNGILGYVLAVAGHEDEARKMLAELQRLRVREYIPAVGIALIYVGLGDKDEALAWLEKGYEERAFQMQFLKVEPSWDPLRNDPRFIHLLRRIGDPE